MIEKKRKKIIKLSHRNETNKKTNKVLINELLFNGLTTRLLIIVNRTITTVNIFLIYLN